MEDACAYINLRGFNRIMHHSASLNGSQSENKADIILSNRMQK
jgi:hypothetical protein